MGYVNSSVNGLYSGNSQTVMEQLKWFTDSDQGFIGTGVNDSFDIIIIENGSHTNDMFQPDIDILLTSNESKRLGYIRNLSFDTSGNEPVTLRARMDFIEGNVITGYNGNTPSVPRDFSVAQGDANGNNTNNTMYITWNLPAENGGSAITSQTIFYKPAGGEWYVQSVSASANALELTGLNSNTNYDFKLAAVNQNGTGSATYVVTKSTTT